MRAGRLCHCARKQSAGDADEGQLPDEAVPSAEPAQPAGPSAADDQGAAPQTAPDGGANGHAQQLHPPQASGHGGAADEDPDELDLYGDMAGAATRPTAGTAECTSAVVTYDDPTEPCLNVTALCAHRQPCPISPASSATTCMPNLWSGVVNS